MSSEILVNSPRALNKIEENNNQTLSIHNQGRNILGGMSRLINGDYLAHAFMPKQHRCAQSFRSLSGEDILLRDGGLRTYGIDPGPLSPAGHTRAHPDARLHCPPHTAALS